MCRLGSPNDALWDVDILHGDEFLQLSQTVHVLYLIAELGAVTKHTNTLLLSLSTRLFNLKREMYTECTKH